MGDGNATGKPCAGCVGNADDKNPPGQAPGGSDHNAGYECDRNQGIGQENPAHTGCQESPGSDGGSTPPVCPVDMAAMTDHEFVINGTTHVDDITGVVKPGDDVEVSFTIAAGCSDVEVSLASYGGDRQLSDSDTGHFAAGDHTLAVTTPDCATEVDFVMGAVVATLGNATGSPYSDQHRLIDAGRSSSSCPGGNVGGSNTDSGSSQGSSQGSSSNTSGSTPAVTVLGSAVNAAAGDAVPATVYAPADVLGLQLAPVAHTARPAEVLGVQYTRSATGELARTGVSTLPIAGLGGILCAVGFALTSVRGRRGTTVSVASRLAGYGIAA